MTRCLFPARREYYDHVCRNPSARRDQTELDPGALVKGLFSYFCDRWINTHELLRYIREALINARSRFEMGAAETGAAEKQWFEAAQVWFEAAMLGPHQT